MKGYIFDDQETYGAGLATLFKQFYAANGGTVVGTASLPGTTTDFKTQMNDAKSKGADIVMFGGLTSTGAGCARRDMIASWAQCTVHRWGRPGGHRLHQGRQRRRFVLGGQRLRGDQRS